MSAVKKYGIWITDTDGLNGHWMRNLIGADLLCSAREAKEIINNRRDGHDDSDVLYEFREYRDLAETHVEAKQLCDRNEVLEKIAAAVVHYREMCMRPHLYSSVQRNGRLALEELDKLLLGFQVKK